MALQIKEPKEKNVLHGKWAKVASTNREGPEKETWPGFPGGSDRKESACNVGDQGSIPGLGRSPGGGLGNLLQYSCLKKSHGQRSLAVYSPRGHKESDTTEWLSMQTLKRGRDDEDEEERCLRNISKAPLIGLFTNHMWKNERKRKESWSCFQSFLLGYLDEWWWWKETR